MSEEIQNTSEVGAEKGDCAEACACLDCISRVAGEIDKKIAKMDTTGLSLGTFRIVNSTVLSLCEYQNAEREQKLDGIYEHGIDMINELLARKNESVLLFSIDHLRITQEEIDRIIASWNEFYFKAVREGRNIHAKNGRGVNLEIRYKNKVVSFVLEELLVDNSDEDD